MKKTYKTATGLVLKTLRNENQMTLKDVTSRIGRSVSWLGDIESGRNSIYFDDLIDLLEIYRTDISVFQYLVKRNVM